jgi:hypothetical protein
MSNEQQSESNIHDVSNDNSFDDMLGIPPSDAAKPIDEKPSMTFVEFIGHRFEEII